MIYAIDFEFIEDGRTIDPISVGIACEDSRTLYREFLDVDWSKASSWVIENVEPHLLKTSDVLDSADNIADEIVEFVGDKPEFWGYYADYDWVALCQLYGRMVDLPKGWPMSCMDLKQHAVGLGNPKLPKQSPVDEHHALADALWVLDTIKYLAELEGDL